MPINRIKTGLTVMLVGWALACSGQSPKPSFVLNNDETGATRNYQAVSFISLKPGFSYKASSGATFRGWINSTLSIPVTPIANPKPGDVSGASSDKPYSPGSGSYQNDGVTGLSGVTSSPISGASGTGSSGTSGSTVSQEQAFTYPVLWFKTVPLTNNLNGAYHWYDVTGGGAVLRNYHTGGAMSGTEFQTTRDTMRTFNFNPAMDLSVSDVSKEIRVEKSNLSQATLMGVWGARDDFDKNRFLFALNGRRNEGVVFSKQWVAEGDPSKSLLIYSSDTVSGLQFNSKKDSLNGYKSQSLKVATYYRTTRPEHGLWGESQKSVISMGGRFDSANVNNTSHFADSLHRMPAFKGYTPELLVFNKQLTREEANRYESYLALKYGITLQKSYVSATGKVLWDYSRDKAYSHRVIGYGREDAVGFNQKSSSSSYDEAPYFSFMDDSYERNDSYRSSSQNRLLVMGYEPGNSPDNGNYVLCGDNGGALSFGPSEATGVSFELGRIWKLYNYSEGSASGQLRWNGPLAVSDEVTKGGDLSTLSAVTDRALKGRDGYMAWTVEQECGPVTLKFGGQTGTPGTSDYGYRIDSVGRVYALIQGSFASSPLFNAEKGQRIEMEKNGDVLSLRVNGVHYKTTEIEVSSSDKAKAFYGSISMGSNPYGIKLSRFRHGGFDDTGHRLELSRRRIPELSTLPKEKIFLLIDRSGSGDFGSNADVIACDETDDVRSKLIFNKLFWDSAEQDGRICFTFGYYDPNAHYVKDNQPIEPKEDSIGCRELQIYYPDRNDMSHITVKVRTTQPTETSVMVFDLSGRVAYHQKLPGSSDEQYADIHLPGSGVYVVRVINNEIHHTQKVVSQ